MTLPNSLFSNKMSTICSNDGTWEVGAGVKVTVDVTAEVDVGGWNGVVVSVGPVVIGVGVDVGGTQETNSEARSKIRNERLIGSPNSSKSFLVGMNYIKFLEKLLKQSPKNKQNECPRSRALFS